MSARCVECGSVPSAGARFCPACGATLGDVAARPVEGDQATALAKALGAGYEVVRLLGRGGMGAVYLARETALDRLVAVKVLAGGTGDDTAMRDRFRREARIAARLTHPNIVPLHTFGEASSLVYFVMGYVGGESLAARLRRQGRIPTEDAQRILAEVADALDYAHRQGILHRDVKPDNILIDDETGRGVLADFGVARAIGAGATMTATGMVVGTPAYMSPEQASGKGDLDGRSDLFSLGAVGYAMLAGRPPFEGGDARKVVIQRLTAAAPPLQSVAPDAPDDLASAVDRCLRRDPALRWPDARSLRDAIAVEGSAAATEALSEVQGVGAAWIMSVLAAFGASVYRWGMGTGAAWASFKWVSPLAALITGLLQAAPLLVAMMVSSAVVGARRAGASWAAILSAALRTSAVSLPPVRLLPGDVWPRLPRPIRRARIALAVARILFFFLVVPSLLLLFTPAAVDGTAAVFVRAAFSIWIPAAVTFVALWAPQVIRLRRRGFFAQEVSKLLYEPSWRPAFWRHPKIAAVLLAPVAAAPRRPAEYLRAISSAVQGTGGVTTSVGATAVALAKELLLAIERFEAEEAELRPQANPSDQARLEERLASLGDPRAGEPDEKRQLREVLERQRDLGVRLGNLVEARNVERGRLIDLLDRIWRDVQRVPSLPPAEARALAASWRSCADALDGVPRGPVEAPTEALPRRPDR